MYILLFLFALRTVCVVCEFDPATHENWGYLEHGRCGYSTAERIIGGKNAALGAYPWIARIGYISEAAGSDAMFRCGAVILHEKIILTAAHCVYKLPNNMTVGVIRVGEYNTETDPDCDGDVCSEHIQDLIPAEIIVHEDYGNPAFKNDIALIRLVRRMDFSPWVKPICMISGSQMTKNYVGSFSEVAGWGIYDIDDPKPSIILQTVTLPIVENDICKRAFVKHASIGNTQMCVGGRVGQDSCGGDSGGPLMKPEDTEGPARYYLLGIVSFGAKKCGGSTMPGVYTRMASYAQWVLDNLFFNTVHYLEVLPVK